MREVVNCTITCLIIVLVGIMVKGSIESHDYTIHTIKPQIYEEEITLSQKTYEIPEVPDVRMATFEDEFAVKPLVRNLTEYDWQLLESIAIAEAGNQDVEGVALIMNVVLNRCEKTGQSVHSVIFSPNQFYVQGMSGGNELSAAAREMVRSGWDESQGAIYFCSQGYNYYGEPLFRHQDHWFSA